MFNVVGPTAIRASGLDWTIVYPTRLFELTADEYAAA